MLAFGDFENTTIHCLTTLTSDSLSDIPKRLELGLRLDLIASTLGNREEQGLAEIAECAVRIKRYLKRRHLIAHNSVQFSFFVASDNGSVRITNEIVSSRDSRVKMGLAELRTVANEVEALAHLFSVLWLEAVQEHRKDLAEVQ